jgi:hypothetical protein
MKSILFSSVLVLVTSACSSDPDALARHPAPPGATGDGTGEAPPPPEAPVACTSREYKTFDGSLLTKGRAETPPGNDRARLKPFESLASEYARVLGATPASLAGAAATFASPPKRWYSEPQGNAVALETAYAIAFDGCLDFTASDAAYSGAPDATSAPAVCADMARRFWSKTPTPAEIQPCVDVATTGAASEPAPRRKWAYACASVLTAAGFLTY